MPAARPAAVLALAAALTGTAGSAPVPRDAADTAAVLAELALPPLRPGVADPLTPDALRRLDPVALKRHAADGRPATPYRSAVARAFDAIRKRWAPPADAPGLRYREFLPADLTPELKRQLVSEQEGPAIVLAELEEQIRELESVAAAAAAAGEPPRWRAHHAYALAQAHQRLAFAQEYNLLLGWVRKEEMPPLDPARGHDGWRLVPAAQMTSKKDVQKSAAVAKKLFQAVARDHPGTPWAVLAERDADLPLGLRWEPAVRAAHGK